MVAQLQSPLQYIFIEPGKHLLDVSLHVILMFDLRSLKHVMSVILWQQDGLWCLGFEAGLDPDTALPCPDRLGLALAASDFSITKAIKEIGIVRNDL